MLRSNSFAMAAAGLCLAVAPAMVGAQSASPGNTDAAYVPLVDACVTRPTVEACQEVRAVIAECASDLDQERCSVLFEDAEGIFGNPERLASSQTALSKAAEAIAALEFPGVQHSDVIEATRADAERTMLRGDENLMSHSAPPNLDGDAPPSGAEPDEPAPLQPAGE